MTKPNRKTQKLETPNDPAQQAAPAEARELISKATTQDVTSVRAKNTGHGKKTADKWNQ